MTNKYVFSILISVSIAHAEADTRVCDAILEQAVIDTANGSTQQAHFLRDRELMVTSAV